MMSKPIASKLPDNYDPLKDDVYMSSNMLCYFKNKLEQMHKLNDIIEVLHYDNITQREQEYLKRKEIEEALYSIEEGYYGYCQITGDPIGVECLIRTPTIKFKT